MKQHVGPRAVLGYARLSVANGDLSIGSQVARIRAWANEDGRHVDDVLIDDGVSGKSLERPAMARLLDQVAHDEVACVVVFKLDRLSRSVADLRKLVDLFIAHDVALVSLHEHVDTSTAAGRMFVSLLGVFAEFERESIVERTKTALAHRRANGRAYGVSTPFGWRKIDGKQLIEEPSEQSALAEAHRMRGAGATYDSIGKMLVERGHKPRGAKWYPSVVRSILTNKMSKSRAAA